MNKLIQLFLTTLLWRNYKVMIISFVALILSFVVLGIAHDDYLQWAQLQEQPVSVGWSFIAKYLAYVLFIWLFYWYNNRVNKQEEAKKLAEEEGAGSNALKNIIKAKFSNATKRSTKKSAKATKANNDIDQSDAQTDLSDPFANIRKKEKLRSHAEIVIEKHTPK